MIDQVDQIMSIMDAAFDPKWGERWTRRQISDALIMPNTAAIVVDNSGVEINTQHDLQPAGFALTRGAADEEELLLIAVHPNHRGNGLGKQLIELMQAKAKARGVSRIFLEMRSNNPAERLYRKMGFEPIGRRTNYYRTENGEQLDAITFGITY